MHRLKSRHTFHRFKTIGWHDDGFGGRVILVVCPPNPLDQPFDVFWCPDLNDQIDIAPVYAKIKTTGTDNRPKLSVHHGLFDFVTLLSIKTSVVNCNWKRVVVLKPKSMEKNLSLRAGVVKNECYFMLAHLLENLRNRITSPCPSPRQMFQRIEHANIRRCPRIGKMDWTGLMIQSHEACNRVWIIDRGRQSDPAQLWGQRLYSAERQHQLIASFAFAEGMDFIDNNPLEICKYPRGIFIRNQKR